MLKACIDTNVWISGILFTGKPADVVTAAFNRKFEPILSKIILNELERNLLTKFRLSQKNVKRFIHRILQVSDLYEPQGTIKIIPGGHTDNLVLETAILGRARYLVTGDREHLLPLKIYKNIKIIDPSHFISFIK